MPSALRSPGSQVIAGPCSGVKSSCTCYSCVPVKLLALSFYAARSASSAAEPERACASVTGSLLSACRRLLFSPCCCDTRACSWRQGRVETTKLIAPCVDLRHVACSKYLTRSGFMKPNTRIDGLEERGADPVLRGPHLLIKGCPPARGELEWRLETCDSDLHVCHLAGPAFGEPEGAGRSPMF